MEAGIVPSKERERPLLELAAERTREIHARCVTVERACAAIGFTPGSCSERVAVLIARVAGADILRRTAAEIAADSDVGFSAKQVRRAVEILTRVGVIESDELPAPDWHSVGKRPRLMLLRLRWEHVRDVVAKETAWRQNMSAEVVPAGRSELGTCQGHATDMAGTTQGHAGDMVGSCQGHLRDHSYVSPIFPSSPSPREETPETGGGDGVLKTDLPTESEAIREAVVSAGVERVRQLIDEAHQKGVSAGELIDAAYVVTHWGGLSSGALFDWVRSGGWPASGVPPAERLRHERREAAERIRSTVRSDASQREIEPPAEVIAAVICKRLRATKPKGCKTDLSDEITAAEMRGEAIAIERRGVSYAK
jgi:hypothetical protein